MAFYCKNIGATHQAIRIALGIGGAALAYLFCRAWWHGWPPSPLVASP